MLIVLVSTFSGLMRNLCLSSALLSETRGAASHLPLLSHTRERRLGELWQRQINCTMSVTCSLSLVLLHLPLFSLANIKLEVWKGKNLLSGWRRLHVAARLSDLTDKAPLFRRKVWHANTHTHTLWGICSTSCRAIWPSHEKRLDVVRGEELECFTALTKFVHSSTSLRCSLLSSHDAATPFSVNKRQDNGKNAERSEYQHFRILHFYFSSRDTDQEDREKEQRLSQWVTLCIIWRTNKREICPS